VYSSGPIKLIIDNNEILLSTHKEMVACSNNRGIQIISNQISKSTGQVEGNRIKYDNIYSSVSDEYEVLSGEIKNNVILSSKPTGVKQLTKGWYGFRETISLPNGWSITSNENEFEMFTSSCLSIRNEEGVMVALIPEPIFFEKDNVDSDGSGMVKGKFFIEENKGYWNLSTLIPVNWLSFNRKITQSMSRKGNCWDNAVAESFFKTIKHKWLCRFKFNSYQQLYSSIEDYINWYNNERLHSSLDYLTPLEMEVKLREFIKIAA